jgi:hypothetical protein
MHKQGFFHRGMLHLFHVILLSVYMLHDKCVLILLDMKPEN